MNATDLIAEFAQRAGVPQLQLSDEGTASLVIDGRTTVNLEHDAAARRLFAYVSLGEPPAADREGYYARLLGANLFGHGTGGGTIGLDPAGNEVLLSRALDLDLVDYTAFEAALESLVDAAERLAGELSSAAPAPMAAGAGYPDPRLAAMLRA